MARLKSAPRRLAAASPRIATPQPENRDAARREARPSRKWYSSARWQKLRKEIIKRDRHICQQTGALLTGRHPAGNSPAVDHIVPHHDDPALFWDRDNLQTVSKAWHDSEKQRRERAGLA